MDQKISQWRTQIDVLDEELLHLLVKRFQIVTTIGAYKKKHHMPIRDESRWSQMLSALLSKAEKLHISKKFVKELFQSIHEYALEIESEKNI